MPVFPVLTCQLSKQQNSTRTTSSTILRPLNRTRTKRFPGHPTRQKQPRAKNKPQRPPANPSPLPRRSPSKRKLTAQNPLKISPLQPPHGEGSLGDPFGSMVHLLTRACFLSRRMAWVPLRKELCSGCPVSWLPKWEFTPNSLLPTLTTHTPLIKGVGCPKNQDLFQVLRSPPPSTEPKTRKPEKSQKVSREEFGTPRPRTPKKSKKVRKVKKSLKINYFLDFSLHFHSLEPYAKPYSDPCCIVQRAPNPRPNLHSPVCQKTFRY